jgi:hypothetical protein
VIVVDSNLIVLLDQRGPNRHRAARTPPADPDWQVPLLWRSEVRNSLAGVHA